MALNKLEMAFFFFFKQKGTHPKLLNKTMDYFIKHQFPRFLRLGRGGQSIKQQVEKSAL